MKEIIKHIEFILNDDRLDYPNKKHVVLDGFRYVDLWLENFSLSDIVPDAKIIMRVRKK